MANAQQCWPYVGRSPRQEGIHEHAGKGSDMTVRRLKLRQRGHACSWCTNKATHRGYGFGKLACADHMTALEQWDRRESAPDYSDAAFYGGF